MLAHREEILREARRAREVILFLDYDGTLVPFANKPGEALPSKELRELLRGLLRNPKIKIGIISGRPVGELKTMLPVRGMAYAGLHGIEIELPGGNFLWKGAERAVPLLERIKHRARRELGEAYIEDKKLTLALHYRCLPEERKKAVVKKFLKLVEEDGEGILEVLHGAEVVEARPRGWDKGRAVEVLLKRMRVKDGLVFYFGDDATDEEAILRLRKGVTVLVSEERKPTSASYYLRNPGEVIKFLKLLSRI